MPNKRNWIKAPRFKDVSKKDKQCGVARKVLNRKWRHANKQGKDDLTIYGSTGLWLT